MRTSANDPSTAPAGSRRTVGSGANKPGGAGRPLWHERDVRSQKSGPHAMVYLMNGDTYLGEWKDNKKHGKGTYTCARTGSVYEGEWKNDCRDGYGTLSVRVIPADASSPSKSSPPSSTSSSMTSLARMAAKASQAAKRSDASYASLRRSATGSAIASSLSLLDSKKVPEDRSSSRSDRDDSDGEEEEGDDDDFGDDGGEGEGEGGGGNGERKKNKGGAAAVRRKRRTTNDDESIFSASKHRVPKTAYPLRKLYAGGWKDDKRKGFGTYFCADGSYYEGEWENGVKKGWGTMHYRDGSRYDGEWFDEKRHGQGILLLPNQDRYEGMWLNDRKEGPGKFIYKIRRQAYEGEWVKGTPRCGTLVDLPPLPGTTIVDDGSRGKGAAVKYPNAVIDATQAMDPRNWKSLGGRGTRFLIPKLGLASPLQVINTEREHIVEERVRRLLHKSDRDAGSGDDLRNPIHAS